MTLRVTVAVLPDRSDAVTVMTYVPAWVKETTVLKLPSWLTCTVSLWLLNLSPFGRTF